MFHAKIVGIRILEKVFLRNKLLIDILWVTRNYVKEQKKKILILVIQYKVHWTLSTYNLP